MRAFQQALPTGGIDIDLSCFEWASAIVEVDSGTLSLLTEIDGFTTISDVPEGRSWRSGDELRQGIDRVWMRVADGASACSVSYDVGADAGLIGVASEISVSATKQAAITEKGIDLASGGTAEVIAAANGDRRYLLIQNRDSAEVMYVGVGVTAVADESSILLEAAQSFVMEGSFVSTDAISVLAATTNHQILCLEG